MKTSIAVAAFLFSMCVTGFTQPTKPTQRAPRSTPKPATRATLQTKSAEQARLLETWRISMAQTPLPKKGSFKASYPSKEWREVPSTTASPYPMVPRRRPRPLVVGNSDDVAAQAPSGHISSATRFVRECHRRYEREWTHRQHWTIRPGRLYVPDQHRLLPEHGCWFPRGVPRMGTVPVRK